MSGILLPGQDKKKPSESKIELPGGFGSRKPEPPQAPSAPAAPQPAAPPAAAAAASAPQRQRPGADLLFPPTGAQVQCPSCSTPYVVPIFTIIDLGANPELKSALLGGQVNVAVCPNCGMGGPLSAPLMVHVPDKQFLGVVIPGEARVSDVQRQKVIGDLTQALMRKLPTEARKGYMLQPKQFADWQRFMEQMWEFEGVTPEMIRRQRAQAELLDSLLSLANDRKALEIALQRGGDLIDRSFFTLLDRTMIMVNQQGSREDVDRFGQLRANLLEMTPVGREVAIRQERIRAVLGEIKPTTTREELVDLLLKTSSDSDGREIAASIIVGVPNLFDYQFLLALTERVEKSTDADERKFLEEMRELAVSVQEQQRQSQQAMVQQAQQVLQTVLQATDSMAALREHADLIDDTFMALLANNIQRAERNNSKAAAQRLLTIYEQAMAIVQEDLPEDVQLINQLVSAPDKASLNELLEAHRDALTPEFVESLKQLETQMRSAGRSEVADRIKTVRGQVSLKR